MSEQVAVRIPEGELRKLDAVVESGLYQSRAAAIRAGIHLLLRLELEREIADEYRRAYGGDAPQEAWVGDVGLHLGSELIAKELAVEEDRA